MCIINFEGAFQSSLQFGQTNIILMFSIFIIFTYQVQEPQFLVHFLSKTDPIPNLHFFHDNFSYMKGRDKYICFFKDFPDPETVPNIASIQESFQEYFQNRCFSFAQGFCNYFKLCHFKDLSYQNKCDNSQSKPIILGHYSQTELILQKNQLISRWPSYKIKPKKLLPYQNSQVFVSYQCDPTISLPGTISEIHQFNKGENTTQYNITLLSPFFCSNKKLQPKPTTSLYCIPYISLKKQYPDILKELQK